MDAGGVQMVDRVVDRPVAALDAAVDALLVTDPQDWSLDGLSSSLVDIPAVVNKLLALQTRNVASFDARGGAQVAGARSTASWLAKQTRLEPSHAGWLVHTARALRDDLPETAAALADGRIAEGHVRVIRRGLDRLAGTFTKAEAVVVGYAATHTVRETRLLVDLMIQQYCPDEDDFAHERRGVHLSKSLGGWWHLDGLLDPATGEKLSAAFDVFAQPVSPDDSRTGPQRHADALAEVADRALTETDRASGSGHVTITLTPEQLSSGLGVTWPSGLLASRRDVALLSCTAQVTYVVAHRTHVGWAPLAVGFAYRYASKAQRAALAVRDGAGCVHPGCTVSASRCIAHHVQHWRDGGPTDVPNLVLTCRYHHREVHHGRLALIMQDGRYTTVPANKAPPLAIPA
jgi:hypothetical protein